ncbi:PepSY domain-containing protein [Solilutibacter tolerans]|uniref:Peptidase propeptide and YPEB domain-containing protein n=1 Tax=Solilutibacter tolerans TaxID=1604334 RepID=A0A1N6N475_9GAMM|nr:hypothetical protein [Lysobacter tolerans]SIP86874.1 hypothetical protein SAMN05421546_0082 [Lysobacter tolerans]
MRLALATSILVLSLLPAVGVAQGLPLQAAEPRMPTRTAAFAPPAKQGMPDAVRRVERQTGGQVLNVESMRFQGREIHRVKVLEPGGRIRIIVDDPGRGRPGQAEPAFRSTRDDDKGKPKL